MALRERLVKLIEGANQQQPPTPQPQSQPLMPESPQSPLMQEPKIVPKSSLSSESSLLPSSSQSSIYLETPIPGQQRYWPPGIRNNNNNNNNKNKKKININTDVNQFSNSLLLVTITTASVIVNLLIVIYLIVEVVYFAGNVCNHDNWVIQNHVILYKSLLFIVYDMVSSDMNMYCN